MTEIIPVPRILIFLSYQLGSKNFDFSVVPARCLCRLLFEVEADIMKENKEALIKSARADGERFCFQTRFGK